MNNLSRSLKSTSSVDYRFFCYTDDPTGLDKDINILELEPRDDVEKQWYKIDFHHMPIIAEGKCLIVDIDYQIVGDMDEILSWDLPNHHFGCNYRWWSSHTDKCAINGGFQMFYQGQTKHLYDIFYQDPKYWQKHYIDIGHAVGPVNGEQNFVDEHVSLKRSWLPQEWFAKYHETENSYIQSLWNERVCSEEPFYLGGEFDSRIKMVHYSGADNIPPATNGY